MVQWEKEVCVLAVIM